jgi:hypothetical protein
VPRLLWISLGPKREASASVIEFHFPWRDRSGGSTAANQESPSSRLHLALLSRCRLYDGLLIPVS